MILISNKKRKTKLEIMGSPTVAGGGHDHGHMDSPTKSLMDNLLGLLRIRIKRGVNLAVRDVRSSDPYVVVRMGKQVCVMHVCLYIVLGLATLGLHQMYPFLYIYIYIFAINTQLIN